MITEFITDPVKTEFPILYKYTNKGQVQQWQIIQEGNKFYTVEGILEGKLTTSLPTVCKGKNTGKKNETTDEQQAYLEAQAKWQKKVDSGYNETLSAEKKFFEPMLAHEYSKYPNIPFDEIKVFVQPKLDGLRAISQDNTLMSRNGKPYLACPHLYQTGVILDGELYNHDLKEDFNKIVSLCKKQKPTQEELDESYEIVEHWIYDFPSHPGTFSERFNALTDWYNALGNPQGLTLVPTFEVKSMDEIKERHAEFIGEGYEGTIIRLDGPYENKRSKNLLKFKDFIDEEFEIIDFEEGEGGRVGTIGKFWCWLDKSKPYVIDKKNSPNAINCFGSNVKGNFEYLRKVWEERDTYIGKTATVKYFNRTPDKGDGKGNKPRFPFIIKINREEYE